MEILGIGQSGARWQLAVIPQTTTTSCPGHAPGRAAGEVCTVVRELSIAWWEQAGPGLNARSGNTTQRARARSLQCPSGESDFGGQERMNEKRKWKMENHQNEKKKAAAHAAHLCARAQRSAAGERKKKQKKTRRKETPCAASPICAPARKRRLRFRGREREGACKMGVCGVAPSRQGGARRQLAVVPCGRKEVAVVSCGVAKQQTG
ncbi:hypothetical protein C8J57DRAFT_1254190 [Mycena rebaudengoi]|nr:hypothetical protein C8J57DRAFT_1259416 [Mycena rebaudengoi]KAJ7220996.1 hypothetical protein C8J57DRAFT_1254190 [Mycena rebaudengoi]